MSVTEAKMAERAVVAWLTDQPDVLTRLNFSFADASALMAEFAGLDDRARHVAVTHPFETTLETLTQDAAIATSRRLPYRFPEDPAFWRNVVPLALGSYLTEREP